jgi:hypothetical protein
MARVALFLQFHSVLTAARTRMIMMPYCRPGHRCSSQGTAPSALWVPKTSPASCDQVIFVDQATDASVSSDTVLVEVDRFGQRLERSSAAEKARGRC